MNTITSLKGLVNSHTHSPHGPHFNGVLSSGTFESYMIECTALFSRDPTPEEAYAFALVTGLENIRAGNTAIVDQALLPLTSDHYHSVAQAYEDLGIHAWVFTEISDLPFAFYTSEHYPEYDESISAGNLPEELREISGIRDDHQTILTEVEEIIRGWQGDYVNIGLGLDNPVWCSDNLLVGAAQLASKLDIPISFHAEESRVQRYVHLAKWGVSGIERCMDLGLLGPRTLVTHAVQVDRRDIGILASGAATVSHNPISNLKLNNGVAPIGEMAAAGINICLGSDGSSAGDSQSIFAVMKFVAALSSMNGLAGHEEIERQILRMASENASWLWEGDEVSEDFVQFASPIGPVGYVWDEPALKIREVYIGGRPQINRAKRIVESKGAEQIVEECRLEMLDPARREKARQLANWAQGLTPARGQPRGPNGG